MGLNGAVSAREIHRRLPVVDRESTLVQQTKAHRHCLNRCLCWIGIPQSGVGTPQSDHPQVAHGRGAQLALEPFLEGPHAEVELGGQPHGRPCLAGPFLDEFERAFDDPARCPAGGPDSRFAVVVRLSQQQPVEHETLEVATGDIAGGQPGRSVELLRHQVQHGLETPSDVLRGHPELEAQA